MTRSNNILQELRDLQSPLAEMPCGQVYSVPAGYFDVLVAQVLDRVRMQESGREELNELSPMLNGLSRKMPYEVPAGYFENLSYGFAMVDDHDGAGELQTISPLLAGLKKQMPFEVPSGYFENIQVPLEKEVQSKPVLVSIASKKWMRYAAAAMITGVIAVVGFLITQKKDMEAMPLARFEKKLNKEIKKTSDKDLQDFIQYTDAGLNGEEKVTVNPNEEVNDLLKDVPEEELKNFLEETADAETSSSMMN